MLENLRNKINQILRENVDAPLYVEYLKDMSGENPFELGGKRWQFVWAKYPNGKRDIGVYAFGEDLVYNYESWRKMMGIDKGGENVGASLYDRHFRSDNKNLKEIEVDDENNIDDYYTSDETTDLSFTDDVDSEEKPDYDNDAFIEDKPSGGYNTSFAGKFLGNFEELDVCLASLKAEFKRTNYFPTIWFVSDHGNYWPIDDQGNEIKQSLNENVDEQDSTPKQELLSLQDGFFGTIQITKLTPASMAGYIGKININGTEYNFDAANNTGEWEYFIHGYKNHDENIAGERGFSGNIDELKYEFVDMFGNGKSTPSMIDENFERNKEIAEIIIQQLGGFGKLRAMTGAYNFVAIDNGVQFKIKNPKANCIKIVLNGKDLYDVEIGRLRGADYKVLVKEEDVYVENLKNLIEKSTGMYLSLFQENNITIKSLIENNLMDIDTDKEIEDEIDMMMRPADNGLSYNDQNDIANHWGIDMEDVMQHVEKYLIKRSHKRQEELKYWVKELLSQFNNYNENGITVPSWNDFFKAWNDDGFQEENEWASMDDVKKEFLNQTTDPNQLSLFESYVKQFAVQTGSNYGLWRYQDKVINYFEQVLNFIFKNPESKKLFPNGYTLHEFVTFYNKTLQSSIPWEIWDAIEGAYKQGLNPDFIAKKLIEMGLNYKYSINENNSEKGKWQLGFENTKTFDVSSMYSHGYKTYLQGCRNCNEVTKLNNMFKERQMVGNVYQSLCNCDKCGNYVVFDENKFQTYQTYLKQKGIDLNESIFKSTVSIKSLLENSFFGQSEQDPLKQYTKYLMDIYQKANNRYMEAGIYLQLLQFYEEGQIKDLFSRSTKTESKIKFLNYLRKDVQMFLDTEETGITTKTFEEFINDNNLQEYDNDFDEGPQPGDADYHYDSGHKRANNGQDVFANIDWEVFHESLVRNTAIVKDKTEKGMAYNVNDFTDDDGLLSLSGLKHLEDYGLIYIHGGYPIIDDPKYLDYQTFYNEAKNIWLKDVRVNDDPAHEPSPYRYGNEDSML